MIVMAWFIYVAVILGVYFAFRVERRLDRLNLRLDGLIDTIEDQRHVASVRFEKVSE